jgi:hypothetical protein
MMIRYVVIMFQQQKTDVYGRPYTIHAVLAQPVMLSVSSGRLSWLSSLCFPQPLQQNMKSVPYIRLRL